MNYNKCLLLLLVASQSPREAAASCLSRFRGKLPSRTAAAQGLFNNPAARFKYFNTPTSRYFSSLNNDQDGPDNINRLARLIEKARLRDRKKQCELDLAHIKYYTNENDFQKLVEDRFNAQTKEIEKIMQEVETERIQELKERQLQIIKTNYDNIIDSFKKFSKNEAISQLDYLKLFERNRIAAAENEEKLTGLPVGPRAKSIRRGEEEVEQLYSDYLDPRLRNAAEKEGVERLIKRLEEGLEKGEYPDSFLDKTWRFLGWQ